MSKQYNVDDILLEIKAKKSKQSSANQSPVTFPLTKKAETIASTPVTPVNPPAPEIKEAEPKKLDFDFETKRAETPKKTLNFNLETEKVEKPKKALNFDLETEKVEKPKKALNFDLGTEKVEKPKKALNFDFSTETETTKKAADFDFKPENTEKSNAGKMDLGFGLESEKKERPKKGFSFSFKNGKSEKASDFKLEDEKPAAPKKEKFKVDIPDDDAPIKKADSGSVDYNRYFTPVKDEEPEAHESFRFKSEPMDATRVVDIHEEQPVKRAESKKAPFKLKYNLDDDAISEQSTTVIDPISAKQSGLFPDEMLEEEKPKKGFFRRKKTKFEEDGDEKYDAYPQNSEEYDDSELDDYDSSEDKSSVVHDMRLIKMGLIIRLLLMAVVFGLSTYLAVSLTNTALNLPSFIHPESKLRYFMIANTLVAALGMLICSNTVGGGLLSLLKLKADSDTLPAMATVASLIQGVCFIVKPELLNMEISTVSSTEYTITTAVSLFFPVAMLILFFNLVGKIMTVIRIQKNFKLVASDRSKYSVNMMENKGLLKEWTANLDMEDYLVAYPVKTQFLSRFLEYSYSKDHADNMSAILAPVCILAPIIIAALSYIFNKDVGIAVSTFTAVLCVCTPLTSTIAANWPMLRLANKLTPNGAMVAGYESIDKFADTEGIVMKAIDIFPPENVTLHAIKAFDQSKIDSVIIDAASVVCNTRGMLTGIFTKIIGADKSLLRPAEHVTYEDSMGLSAWVDGKRVLIGNRELMINHGVEVPSMDYEKRYVKDSRNIVYLSNSGELSAMFVISYNANPTVQEELDQLNDYGMSLIVETSDPNITAEKIHEAYDFPLEQLQLMPAKTNSQYRSMTEEQSKAPAHIGYIGGTRTMIRAIMDCIKVKSSISQSVVIQMASLIIGYGIVAVFSLVGELGMLSFAYLILYQLFWTLLVFIIPNLKKL